MPPDETKSTPYKAGYGPVEIQNFPYTLHAVPVGLLSTLDVVHLMKCIGLPQCLQCESPGAMQGLTIQTAIGLL